MNSCHQSQGDCGNFPPGSAGGWAWAFARFGSTLNRVPDTLDFDADFQEYTIDPNTPLFSQLTREVSMVLLDGVVADAHYVIDVNVYHDDSGLTLDPILGLWQGSSNIAFPSEKSEIQNLKYIFDDVSVDVTGDSRFNQLDVDALPPFFGTIDPNDPDNVERFDYDGDGDFDADDQNILQGLVDLDLDSKIFADFDDSGTVDCSDHVNQATYLGQNLGDADYAVALDRDLDGVIDQNDLDWAQRAVLPGDIDADNDVDLSDYALLTSSYGKCLNDAGYNPHADITGDDCVDLADLSILLANWGESCP